MNDRFKFRVWDIEEWGYLKCKYSKSAGYHKYTFGKHNIWQDIGYFIESNPKYYIVEQCTGLKDKNGKLIYEGDIVRCSDGNIYNICWSDSAMIIIAVNTTTKIGDAIYKLKCYNDVEIIGNIHEQAEQKD